MSATAQRLVRLIPEHVGCSAEWLRMQTGWTLQQVEEGLHQAVATGLAIRKDNRYLRLVVHPAPAPATDPAPTPDEPPPPVEDTPMAKTKTYIKCDEDLPLAEFGDDSRTDDGKARTCKGCRGKPGGAVKKPAKAAPARVKAKPGPKPSVSLKSIVTRHAAPGGSLRPARDALLEDLRAQSARISAAIAALEAL